MIEISNLQVEREGKRICIVDQLSVAAAEKLAILGTNGSGKTTLLRVLAGLTSDFSGTCRIAVDTRQRTYLHQQPYLFRGTVLTNVQYGEQSRVGQGAQAKNSGARDSGARNSGARNWLDRLHVGHLAERSTADLSGGERRRVALARALAMRPKLLLLDEPLADLDDEATAIVCKTLLQLTETTIVIASPIALPGGLVDRCFTML